MALSYVFIGSVEYSAWCLRALAGCGADIREVFCLHRDASVNSDYHDLGPMAEELGLSYRYFVRIGDETSKLAAIGPDVVFALGTSQILPPELLKVPRIGVVGSHPTLLPRNRGSNPIIWSLANGLTEGGVTLFWMDKGIDTGDIWAQKGFEITEADDAASVYEKVKAATGEIIGENLPDLERGVVRRVRQDDRAANRWRRRTKRDGGIDWRMGSKRIYDLVRALARPYPGAHCRYLGGEAKVWEVRMDSGEGVENIEPGRVLSVEGSSFRVKTGDGVVEVLRHELDPVPMEGECL